MWWRRSSRSFIFISDAGLRFSSSAGQERAPEACTRVPSFQKYDLLVLLLCISERGQYYIVHSMYYVDTAAAEQVGPLRYYVSTSSPEVL